LKNVGSSNAGMIAAGKFLEHFTKFPWLHLDIAGPAYSSHRKRIPHKGRNRRRRSSDI
jgi:leucyl aminopeptidase